MNEFCKEILACPACGSKLTEIESCESCGESFSVEDGVPRLIAGNLHKTVNLEFDSARARSDPSLLARVLRYPPTDQSFSDLPYHLHPAHAERLANLSNSSRVLEIGCGGGQNRDWMRRQNLNYVGVDYSRTRVFDWLQKFGGADLLSDAHSQPFADAAFDAIYTTAVFEHLACPWLAAQEAWRVLKPGGLFLGGTAFLEPWHDDSFFHLTPIGVTELLIGAGFDVEFVWPGERYWTVFYSVPHMVGYGPFKWLRYAGRLIDGLYITQNWILNLARRLTGRRVVPRIVSQSVVAGAIYWIARRPAA